MRTCILMLLTVLLLYGCGSTKKSTMHSTIKKDSATEHMLQRSNDSFSVLRSLTIRDTLISVPARVVKDTISAADLQPAYTKEGIAVKRSYSAVTKGAQAFINVLPDGNVEYGCNADSLTIVVQSLIRENTELRRQKDSVQLLSKTESKQESTELHNSVLKTRSFLSGMWPWLLAFVLIIIAVYLVKRVIKWPL